MKTSMKSSMLKLCLAGAFPRNAVSSIMHNNGNNCVCQHG